MDKTHPEKIACIQEGILFEKGKWNGIKVDDLEIFDILVKRNH